MTHAVQVSIPYFTNIAKDVVTNVWHFDWVGFGAPGASDFVNLENDLVAFYNGVFNSLANAAMAPWVNPALTKQKVYDLADPTPRVPVHQATTSLTVSQAGTSIIPPEVALAVSYQADPISGVPQSRRRGRIFLGGIGAGTVAGTTVAFPLPSPTLISNAATRATALQTAALGHSWAWSVYSRVNHSSSLVTNGWVDNAFDTQRRRGQAASARTLWS